MPRWIPRDSNAQRLLASAVAFATLAVGGVLFGEEWLAIGMFLLFCYVMILLYASELRPYGEGAKVKLPTYMLMRPMSR